MVSTRKHVGGARDKRRQVSESTSSKPSSEGISTGLAFSAVIFDYCNHHLNIIRDYSEKYITTEYDTVLNNVKSISDFLKDIGRNISTEFDSSEDLKRYTYLRILDDKILSLFYSIHVLKKTSELFESADTEDNGSLYMSVMTLNTTCIKTLRSRHRVTQDERFLARDIISMFGICGENTPFSYSILPKVSQNASGRGTIDAKKGSAHSSNAARSILELKEEKEHKRIYRKAAELPDPSKPHRAEVNRSTKLVQFRLAPNDIAALDRIAFVKGLSRAGWITQLVLEALEQEKPLIHTDQEDTLEP